MSDGIGSGCYGNWRQLATNSYLHLQTISNDTCLCFLGFLKSHFLKQEIRFFMQQKKKRIIIFNYIHTNINQNTTYYSFYSLQYYETYKHDMLKEYRTTPNILNCNMLPSYTMKPTQWLRKMGIFVLAFFINKLKNKMSQFFIPLSDKIHFTGISTCGIKVKSQD